MRYVPYGPELEGVANVAVDGRGNEATVLELSHWPGNRTPEELKADTSTEIALNYTRVQERERYAAGAEAVSNNHFDGDGVLAMWTVLEPDEALRRAELLIAAAACSDFERWEGEGAAKVACVLSGFEAQARVAAGATHDERTAQLYQEALELLPRLLDEPDAFEERWREGYDAVQAGREAFGKGGALVQEVADVDLAVFTLPRPLPSMALYEQTDCSRIAIAIEDQRYEARYRYESWVELVSHRPPARIDLQPFADMLQTFEGNDGDWVADKVDSITPRLRLRGAGGDPAPSSLTPGLFARLLASFLRDNAENEALRWSPYG